MSTEPPDWYARRHELRQGMVFVLHDGSVVKLTGSVPGDATSWRVADRYNGRWHYEERRVEPCDLKDLLPEAEAGDG